MSAIHPDPKKGTRGGPAILTALYDIGAKHAIENFGSGFMPHLLSIVSDLIIFYGSGLKVSRRQPSGRYALCALPHAIIHLRPSAVK